MNIIPPGITGLRRRAPRARPPSAPPALVEYKRGGPKREMSRETGNEAGKKGRPVLLFLDWGEFFLNYGENLAEFFILNIYIFSNK